jgi:predicted NUDIX family NTP pyrophosphohydrolase
MPKISAGILMYRWRQRQLQVLLVHPGGPFSTRKDDGHWSLPKGEADPGENQFATAVREFEEETGFKPTGEFLPLKPIIQKSGKVVHAWAVEGDLDTSKIRSNTFETEWPPRSGKRAEFPEVDRAEFFGLEDTRRKMNPAQVALVDELSKSVSTRITDAT